MSRLRSSTGSVRGPTNGGQARRSIRAAPHAEVYANDAQSAEAASIDKPFEDVTHADVAGLTFTTGRPGPSLDTVVVVKTVEGNHYKVGFLSDGPDTIEWQQLVLSVSQCEHAEIMEQGADIMQQIGDLSQKVDDLDAKLDTLIDLIENLPINQGRAHSGQ